jgi:hypothetical protein
MFEAKQILMEENRASSRKGGRVALHYLIRWGDETISWTKAGKLQCGPEKGMER